MVDLIELAPVLAFESSWLTDYLLSGLLGLLQVRLLTRLFDHKLFFFCIKGQNISRTCTTSSIEGYCPLSVPVFLPSDGMPEVMQDRSNKKPLEILTLRAEMMIEEGSEQQRKEGTMNFVCSSLKR